MQNNSKRSRYGHECYLCNGPVSPDTGHWDHVVPKSRGGSNCASNLRFVHSICNARKGICLLQELSLPWPRLNQNEEWEPVERVEEHSSGVILTVIEGGRPAEAAA